jgi:hypothetical protein
MADDVEMEDLHKDKEKGKPLDVPERPVVQPDHEERDSYDEFSWVRVLFK